MLEKKRYGTTFTRTYVYIRLKIQNANSKIEGKFDRWKGENGITDGNRSRNFNSSETGASRQFHFDRITVVRNLRTEIKFRFTENEAARSLSPYLSSWYIYIYRIWTTTHAFPFLASFLPSEIIAPFATLFLSLPFRFPLRSLTSLFGRGIETSNFEATREQPLPRRGGLISELRHATRHFGTWFFLELGQNCFHDFHVIRYCVPSLVYQKW